MSDEDEFAKNLIPELFKHNNYASFVRQLNMYGFCKRVNLLDNSMKVSERKNKSLSEYYNPYFKRGHPNLLWLIKPKALQKKRKGSLLRQEEGGVARKAEDEGESVSKSNQKRCEYLAYHRERRERARSLKHAAEVECAANVKDEPSTHGGRHLRKRTQPQKASIGQTSDSEPNEESKEDTDLEHTSDFKPNEQSDDEMSASEGANEHQAVEDRQEPSQDAAPLSTIPAELPGITVEGRYKRMSANRSNIKPVSDSSLRTEPPMPQQDRPRKTLLLKLPVPSLSVKKGLEDGIAYRKHSRGSLSGLFVSLDRDVIEINGTAHVQQLVLVPMGISQPRLQKGQDVDFKMALNGLFEGHLVRPERKVIELDCKDYVRYTVQIPLNGQPYTTA